jgi:hypothetical protein
VVHDECGGHLVEPGPGILAGPPEQPGVGAAGRVGHLGRGDVRKMNRVPAGARRSAASTLASGSSTSTAGGLPALARAIHPPQARNSPSSSHRCASTRIAARKPITGASCLASAPAWPAGIAPAAIRMTAAGTAATASGQLRGLVTAQASTASRAISEIVSAAAAFSASPPGQPVLRAHPTRAAVRSR